MCCNVKEESGFIVEANRWSNTNPIGKKIDQRSKHVVDMKFSEKQNVFLNTTHLWHFLNRDTDHFGKWQYTFFFSDFI